MGEMTNEQAARWLKDLLKSDLPMEQYQTAIEKGIEALEPSGDLISREETLTAFADYVGSGMSMNDYEALWDIVAKMPSVKQEPKTGHWIPVSERLPERAEGGASNWHTDTVMVCMYGNAQYDGYDDFGYEILTGIFEELEDEETKTKDLCFVPDRFTLFIPDEWDFFVLDKNYETHLPKNECMYLVDDYSDKSEFHDKYFKVLAWMPLPKPYESQESEES